MGVAGVNWSTSIVAVKWVSGSGSGFSSDLITAMDWVVAAKQAGVNVRVANDSATWPGTAFSQGVADEIDALGANDILFVTAAGNTGENNDIVPRYPCSYNRPNMICAAASDQNDHLWSSSNFGVSTVHLAAPGVNIYSTMRQNNYGYISGSSMAAAQVSGTAALILSLGYQSMANLRSTILNSVDVLPALASFVATGGRLNVCKAVPGCSTASRIRAIWLAAGGFDGRVVRRSNELHVSVVPVRWRRIELRTDRRSHWIELSAACFGRRRRYVPRHSDRHEYGWFEFSAIQRQRRDRRGGIALQPQFDDPGWRHAQRKCAMEGDSRPDR
jgi:hypothetical protein